MTSTLAGKIGTHRGGAYNFTVPLGGAIVRILKWSLIAAALAASLGGISLRAQQLNVDQVIDRILQRESDELAVVRQYNPVVETYVQDMQPDQQVGTIPTADHYFLGRLDHSSNLYAPEPSKKEKKKEKKHEQSNLGALSGVFETDTILDGFLQGIYVDPNGFDRQHYRLTYLRREFLDEVRCLVFDVEPLPNSGGDRFRGRIWVEDEKYTIVRFNGGRYPGEHPGGFRLHFDSWRFNAAPGVWLPLYVYSAEADVHDLSANHIRFRAQTLLWGYSGIRAEDDDRSQADSQQARQREGEQNALDNLAKAGVLAPAGPVDKILYTIVNNLEVSNNLDIEPDIQCRVLLTSTLEAFTIGHTVVVSRGLLDVLPDEASLAAVLAHEMGHVLTGKALGDEWAFSEWSVLPSGEAFNHFGLPIDPQQEQTANAKAVELLMNSPYKDKLGGAGRFLQYVDSNAKALPNLISPHVESRTSIAAQLLSADTHGPAAKGQPVALPIGSRIQLDAWTAQVDIMKTKPASLVSGAELQPFRLSPYAPHLSRHPATGATTTPTKK
jgi:hypothetical protein